MLDFANEKPHLPSTAVAFRCEEHGTKLMLGRQQRPARWFQIRRGETGSVSSSCRLQTFNDQLEVSVQRVLVWIPTLDVPREPGCFVPRLDIARDRI